MTTLVARYVSFVYDRQALVVYTIARGAGFADKI